MNGGILPIGGVAAGRVCACSLLSSLVLYVLSLKLDINCSPFHTLPFLVNPSLRYLTIDKIVILNYSILLALNKNLLFAVY